MMYEFSGNNALYAASISFAAFIFLLTPFDSYDYYYFN